MTHTHTHTNTHARTQCTKQWPTNWTAEHLKKTWSQVAPQTNANWTTVRSGEKSRIERAINMHRRRQYKCVLHFYFCVCCSLILLRFSPSLSFSERWLSLLKSQMQLDIVILPLNLRRMNGMRSLIIQLEIRTHTNTKLREKTSWIVCCVKHSNFSHSLFISLAVVLLASVTKMSP